MVWLTVIIRYWRYLVLALVLALVVYGIHRYGNAHYERGKSDGVAVMQSKVNAANAKVSAMEHEALQAIAKQADQMAKASKIYQENKAQHEEKEKVRYVKVQKLVENPIYTTNCIDNAGLQQLNDAVGEK